MYKIIILPIYSTSYTSVRLTIHNQNQFTCTCYEKMFYLKYLIKYLVTFVRINYLYILSSRNNEVNIINNKTR